LPTSSTLSVGRCRNFRCRTKPGRTGVSACAGHELSGNGGCEMPRHGRIYTQAALFVSNVDALQHARGFFNAGYGYSSELRLEGVQSVNDQSSQLNRHTAKEAKQAPSMDSGSMFNWHTSATSRAATVVAAPRGSAPECRQPGLVAPLPGSRAVFWISSIHAISR
jgi:hypothetical protein